MTFKDKQELRALDEKALRADIQKAKKYLGSISFDHQQGNLKNTAELRKTRAYVAKMETFLSERKHEAKKAPAAAA